MFCVSNIYQNNFGLFWQHNIFFLQFAIDLRVLDSYNFFMYKNSLLTNTYAESKLQF